MSDEWLRDLWSYVIETRSIDIFEGAIPLVPVFVPEADSTLSIHVRCFIFIFISCTDGQFLLKTTPGVPLLHMMFKDSIPSVVMKCFAAAGLYVFNPEGRLHFCDAPLITDFI